jgi:hypothetical protein
MEWGCALPGLTLTNNCYVVRMRVSSKEACKLSKPSRRHKLDSNSNKTRSHCLLHNYSCFDAKA